MLESEILNNIAAKIIRPTNQIQDMEHLTANDTIGKISKNF